LARTEAGLKQKADRENMKIFLAGIIQGSIPAKAIHDQGWRDRIRQVLSRYLPEAEVYCHYSHHPDSITYALPEIRATIAEGNRLAAQGDVLVAYVPSASMGTAIEMYEAARHGRVVLAISPLSANWVIRAYSDRIFADFAEFEGFLRSGQLPNLIEAKGAQ